MHRHFPSRSIGFAVLAMVAGVALFWLGSRGTELSLQSRIGHEKSTANVSKPSLSPSPTVAPVASSDITILIGGDIMLDRHIRAHANRYGYDSLFSSLAPLFAKADITVANLEGTITSHPSKTLLPSGQTTNSFIFTFATSTAAALARAGITLVSLANNHTDAYGSAGLGETRKWLDIAGIGHFGDPWNSSSTESVMTKNGIKVAFVGYHAFQSGFDRTLSEVRRLKSDGAFVIVMPHWGEEYVATSSALLKEKARALVSAGADAIIGSHPHVVMDHEWVGKTPVFYSLGNLLFDQYFSPQVMKGNIVELSLSQSSTGVKLDRIRVYETSLASKRGVTLGAISTEERP